jgi:anti-sigma B factor antagonist
VNEHATIDVLRFEGELDIGRRAELHDALAISASARAVLIDLSAVTYADSTALGELLHFKARAEERGVPIALVVAAPQFERLIRYAGLYELFSVFDNVGAALSYLGGAS